MDDNPTRIGMTMRISKLVGIDEHTAEKFQFGIVALVCQELFRPSRSLTTSLEGLSHSRKPTRPGMLPVCHVFASKVEIAGGWEETSHFIG
jgi:hypothetical protein